VALEQEAIVEAGLGLLEEEGFEGLSLRKIADALGVQTPALYWHVKSRADLFSLMAEHMFREALADVDESLDARDWLLGLGRSLYATHNRRRNAASLVGAVMPTPGLRHDLLGQVAARLAAGGLDPDAAFVVQSAVLSLTLGWSLFLSNPHVADLMQQSIDVDEGFEKSLVALVNGLFGDAPITRPLASPLAAAPYIAAAPSSLRIGDRLD